MFTRAAKKWPDDSTFSFGRAVARYQAGNYLEAKSLLENVLSKFPAHSGARSMLAGMVADHLIPGSR